MDTNHAPHKSHTKLVAIILILVALIIAIFAKKDVMISGTGEEALYYEGDIVTESFALADESFAPMAAKSRIAESGDFLAPIPEPNTNGVPVQESEKKIIKNGSLSLNVQNADAEAQAIRDIAQSHGGDILGINFYANPGFGKSGYLTVKVPAEKFDLTFDAIKERGTLVTNESISTNDVTSNVRDLEEELKSKKAFEEKMRSYLERAENISELLDVEKRLSQARRDVESVETQLKNLSNQTTFSTITVNLTEDAQIAANEGWRPGQVAKDAVNTLISKAQGIVDGTITLFISSLPIFVVTLLGLAIIYKVGKKIIVFIVRRMERSKE